MTFRSVVVALFISAFGLSTAGTLALAQAATQPGQTVRSAPGVSPKRVSRPSVSVINLSKSTIATIDEHHDRNLNRLWITSMLTVAAASGMDAATSWGKLEGNDFLASPNGRFGQRGASIKAALAGAVIVPQIIFRKHKELRTKFTIANFLQTGIFTGIALHNRGVSSR